MFDRLPYGCPRSRDKKERVPWIPGAHIPSGWGLQEPLWILVGSPLTNFSILWGLWKALGVPGLGTSLEEKPFRSERTDFCTGAALIKFPFGSTQHC